MSPGTPQRRQQRYSSRQVWGWVGAFVVLSAAPLLFGVLGPAPAPRPFFVEFGTGLGFVGVGVLAVQLVTTGRFRQIAPVFGADVVLQFHKQAGLVAYALVLAHPVVLLISDPDYIDYLDPRVNLLRALGLSVAIASLTLLIVTSLWRPQMGLRYEWWRALHGVLALVVVFVGMVHGLQVGRHIGSWWEQGVWVGVLCGAMYLVVHSRLVRPWVMARAPYEVVDVHHELGDVVTLTVDPVGHDGLTFQPGQFGWLTLGDTPFSLQQHPFSFSSSALDRRVSFTAKAIGDFTSSWSDVEVGTRAFVEGPYGGFVLDDESPGAVFVAGGIGVTPFMSMLKTMRDRGDRRPVTLVYATASLERATFAGELAELLPVLNLEVHHVLEDPPEGWTGASGFIDRELLDRILPADRTERDHFICGPEPLMDVTESSLRSLGVSWRRIFTERFQIV